MSFMVKRMTSLKENLNETQKTVVWETYFNQTSDKDLSEKLGLSEGIIRKTKLISMKNIIGL